MSVEFLRQIPWLEIGAFTGPFLMALTQKQRQAIIERDEGQSQMRHYNEAQGWHTEPPEVCPYCHGRGCGLEVHHITTQRNGGMDDPRNLITLNRCEHTGVIDGGGFVNQQTDFVVHPDVIAATEAYRQGDKQAFTKMALARDELVQQGEPYWNTDHDQEMLETASERTVMAAMLGWIFPERKK